MNPAFWTIASPPTSWLTWKQSSLWKDFTEAFSKLQLDKDLRDLHTKLTNQVQLQLLLIITCPGEWWERGNGTEEAYLTQLVVVLLQLLWQLFTLTKVRAIKNSLIARSWKAKHVIKKREEQQKNGWKTRAGKV